MLDNHDRELVRLDSIFRPVPLPKVAFWRKGDNDLMAGVWAASAR
jgi:hypothetical protein